MDLMVGGLLEALGKRKLWLGAAFGSAAFGAYGVYDLFESQSPWAVLAGAAAFGFFMYRLAANFKEENDRLLTSDDLPRFEFVDSRGTVLHRHQMVAAGTSSSLPPMTQTPRF